MAVVTREFEPSLTPDDIGWLAGLSDLPVVVKGVQRADDAVRCVDAGAAAIVVSNHGARQLADAPPTADIVGEIADAVADRAEVYVDGGIRRAPDVVKALALGARAVLIGRPSPVGAGRRAGRTGWRRSCAGTKPSCGGRWPCAARPPSRGSIARWCGGLREEPVSSDVPSGTVEDFARMWAWFATHCQETSPLYERISLAVAGDRDLLERLAPRPRRPTCLRPCSPPCTTSCSTGPTTRWPRSTPVGPSAIPDRSSSTSAAATGMTVDDLLADPPHSDQRLRPQRADRSRADLAGVALRAADSPWSTSERAPG